MYTPRSYSPKKTQLLIIGVVLVLVVILFLLWWFGIRTNVASVPTEWVAQLFNTSNSSLPPIPTIKPKPDIFNHPTYAKLKFFTEDIPVEVGERGRLNPFVPFAAMAKYFSMENTAAATSSESIQEGSQGNASSQGGLLPSENPEGQATPEETPFQPDVSGIEGSPDNLTGLGQGRIPDKDGKK